MRQLQAFRTEFLRLRDDFCPADGLVGVLRLNAGMYDLLRQVRTAGLEVVSFACDCLGPRPAGPVAAVDWDEVVTMAVQVANGYDLPPELPPVERPYD